MADLESDYRLKHPGRPRIYDIKLDKFRDVTQRDVDLLVTAASNWAGVKDGVETLAFTVNCLHNLYMAQVEITPEHLRVVK